MNRYLMSIPGVKSKEHLEKVMEEMQGLGAPIIRVVDCGDAYFALEGTHRLRAACLLGIAPTLDVVEEQDQVDLTWMDILDNFPDGTVVMPAGEIVAALRDPYGNGCYRIHDDGLLELVQAGI